MKFSPEGFNVPPPTMEDYTDAPFYSILRAIPSELRTKHLTYIENNGLSDEEASDYLKQILERRKEVMTETHVSDLSFSEKIKGRSDEIFKQIETSVYSDPENYLGGGMTARVMYFEIADPATGETLPTAVKYLVTPTEMTLSASAEHDMLLEVERIQTIEELEAPVHLKHIKVPHPLFHHQNSTVQCYGMELVDGFDLSADLLNMPEGTDKDTVVENLAKLDIDTVEQEIETFFTRMHTYCLHGDIKPANLMVDKTGMFYVIDFGQSRLVNDIPDKAQEQLYTLREDEIKFTKDIIRKTIKTAKEIAEK